MDGQAQTQTQTQVAQPVPIGGPLALMSDRELWERQPDESDRDWGCFRIYRDLHPAVRSLRAAYAEYLYETDPEAHEDRSLVRAPADWFEKLCARNLWVERVVEYDIWMDEQLIQRLKARRVRSLVGAAEIGEEMRNKAMEALQAVHAILYEQVLNLACNLLAYLRHVFALIFGRPGRLFSLDCP